MSSDIENYCGYCDNGQALLGSDVPQCKGCGRVRPKDMFCSVCGSQQIGTPSGPTCENGHGGAPGIETRYPELEKMKEAREKSAVLTEFVNWLDENNMRICERTEVHPAYTGSPYESISMSYEQLFARFFEIDLDKIEKERQQILEELRKGGTG